MLNRLILSFITATREKCTKRQVESIMNDFIYVIYLLIMLVDFVIFASCGTWWTMLATALMFMLLIAGWGTFSYYLRKTLLTLLYPPTEYTDEDGDAREEELLSRLSGLMKTLKEEIQEIKE